MKSSRAAFLAAALLALAAALRLASLDVGWLGVDQGRDLAWAEHIAAGESYPVVGPLMRNRLYLGATYYYFWALPALVAPGPYMAYAFAAILGLVAVAGAGWVAHGIAGDAAGLAAIAWLATSPIAVLDTRIAWAPAALPPACALLLLLACAYLRTPGAVKAAAIAVVASLATQLHLAAAALLPVAGGALLARRRAIGLRGLAIASAAGAIPLLPMALAWFVPVPQAAGTPPAGSPMAHRLEDFLALGARWLEGLSPAASGRPLPVEAWLRLESGLGWLPLAAAAIALPISARVRHPAGLRAVVGALAGCVAIPLLLPAEVWGYYLDAALVPAAVVVGVVVTRPRLRILGIALLAVVCAGRAALLVWWLSTAASQGFVAANLDFLRVGGTRPVAPEARARLLGFGVKQRAVDVLVHDFAIAPERLWSDVHGPAFADLDTDNGYLVGRVAGRPDVDEATPSSRSPSEAETPPRHALVLYAGEVEPSWLAGFSRPERVGPLEIFRYAPVVRAQAASMSGCAEGKPPARPVPDPLDYGAGEPQLPRWPCDRPVVVVPFAGPPPGVEVRVFPRVVGQGRVLAVDADPSRGPQQATAPGLDAGVLLGPGGGELRIRLAIEGPAALDLVELHGRDTSSGAREPSPRSGDARAGAAGEDVG